MLVYFGKKGVKIVIQGNKNSPLHTEIEDLATGNISLGFTDKETNEPQEYIGSDETGKGDVFGPIVTCAMYVNEKISLQLKQAGVRDSKDLGDGQIRKIANQIKKLGHENYELVSINPKKYNELYNKFKNINEILNWTHTKAIENLLKKKPAETIITDKFRKKDLQFSASFSFSNYSIIQEPKAEKYTAVAAASIIAKNKQLEWFDDQKKNGINLKRGASDEVKNLVQAYLRRHNPQQLSEIAKMHFKTVKNSIK